MYKGISCVIAVVVLCMRDEDFNSSSLFLVLASRGCQFLSISS